MMRRWSWTSSAFVGLLVLLPSYVIPGCSGQAVRDTSPRATQPVTGVPTSQPAAGAGAVDPNTTFLTGGQSLDEAKALLRLAKARDVTPSRTKNDQQRKLVYKLASGEKVWLSPEQNDAGLWVVGSWMEIQPPAGDRESRCALNVTGAKFDTRTLAEAFAKADDVFVGKVVSADLKETFWSGIFMSLTEVTYEVRQPLKGDLHGKVTVHYVIVGTGECGDGLWLTPGKPKLREDVFAKGAEHLVFAKQENDGAVNSEMWRRILYMTPHPVEAREALKQKGVLRETPATKAATQPATAGPAASLGQGTPPI